MARSAQPQSSAIPRLAGIAGLLLLLLAALAAQAQTFTILHTFNEKDGWQPDAGLSMDRAGNLYGTTGYGGGHCGEGCGTVFKLERTNSGWVFFPLYAFGGSDGKTPQSRVIFGVDGNLYGTTTNGGAYDDGVVFRLQPPLHACKSFLCPWTETVLYSFQGGNDGKSPAYGDLAFDQAGNIYGTTPNGGRYGQGVVYELTPSNGGWSETVLYSFQGTEDGGNPYAGVAIDNAGNLYGTASPGGLKTCPGGEYCGVVYELTPAGSGWTESVLHSFTGGDDGAFPEGGLIFDPSGNLYGITYGSGVVYELTHLNGSWVFSPLYNLDAYLASIATLTLDPAGNLYGTLVVGSPEVFKLSHSNGGWKETGFNGTAGNSPYGNVILDASGNVYGTASAGGTYNAGLVFEITQ